MTVEIIDVEEMTVEIIDEEEMTAEITEEVGITQTIEIGNAQNATIPILHSERNAIAVASLKDEADEAEGGVNKNLGKERIPITTGRAESAKIPTSHLELSVTAVELQREGAEVLPNSGKATIEGPVTEMSHSQEQEIGNAPNVANLISQKEMSALGVDVLSELAAPKGVDIIVI